MMGVGIGIGDRSRKGASGSRHGLIDRLRSRFGVGHSALRAVEPFDFAVGSLPAGSSSGGSDHAERGDEVTGSVQEPLSDQNAFDGAFKPAKNALLG